MGDLKKIIAGLIFTYLAYLLICHSSFYSLCESWYVDKAFHVAGGYLITALTFHLSGSRNQLILAGAVLVLGVAWEFLEVFFLNPWIVPDPHQIKQAFISFGDIAADVAGFLMYLALSKKKINTAPADLSDMPHDYNRLP